MLWSEQMYSWACPRRVLSLENGCKMAARPLIFALANPTPEIMPEEVAAVRDDAIMATGDPTIRIKSTTS